MSKLYLKEEDKKRWLDTIENDIRAAVVYIGVVKNGELGLGWPIPNGWEEG